MGKTPKPLRMLVAPEILEWPEIKELQAQGHVIEAVPTGPWWDYDLVAGPRCWRMNERLKQYLPLTITEGRKVRYPKEGV
jgi:hypothetical protein